MEPQQLYIWDFCVRCSPHFIVSKGSSKEQAIQCALDRIGNPDDAPGLIARLGNFCPSLSTLTEEASYADRVQGGPYALHYYCDKKRYGSVRDVLEAEEPQIMPLSDFTCLVGSCLDG